MATVLNLPVLKSHLSPETFERLMTSERLINRHRRLYAFGKRAMCWSDLEQPKNGLEYDLIDGEWYLIRRHVTAEDLGL